MSDAEIISVPNALRKAKLGSGPAKLDPALLTRAEKTVAQMAASYTGWVRDDLAELEATVNRLVTAGGDDPHAIKELFRLAFDMKGDGGSFGFPLVTRIAGSLTDFLSGRDTLEGLALEVVVAHVSAINAVILQNVHNDGGATGAELIDGLNKLVRKVHNAPAGRADTVPEPVP